MLLAKLFYLDTNGKETYAEEALESLHKLLDVTHIETLILSENKSSPSCWKTVENLVKSSQVHNLGVTDLDYENLKNFLNSGIEIKPVVDHIHVDECCNMPQRLIQLAKEQGIELLHNNDCTSKLQNACLCNTDLFLLSAILKEDDLTDLLKRYELLQKDAVFKPRWVLKYNVFNNPRHIVVDKG